MSQKLNDRVLPLTLIPSSSEDVEVVPVLPEGEKAANTIDSDILREMVDHALQGIMVHYLHRPLYVNHAWAKFHGLTVDEVMAKPTLVDLVHDVDRKRMECYARDRLAGLQPPERYRYRAIHNDGHIIWLEQFVKIIRWNSGKAIMSTVIDVDDEERRADELRRQREMMEELVRQRTEALTRSNQQLYVYRSIIDQMSERISVIGTDYRFRMTNLANARFRERNPEDLIGVHVREIVGASWFEKKAKSMLDGAFEGRTGIHERKAMSPTGQSLHIEVKTEPFRDPDGAITGAIASIQDVTAAKMVEEQLQLFASVVEQVSDRISVIDRSYCYRLTNKANADYHGKPIEAFVGRAVADIVGEDEFHERSKSELDRCFAGETVRVRRPGRDGEGRDRVLDILFEPYRERDGEISGAAVTTRDVTEAQELSERLAHQARHDQLTGLVNRHAFEQCLEAALTDTAQNSRSSALCFIDLDQFKVINDTVGHLIGDRLLKEVSKLLRTKIGKGDVLARLGGDEFGLLLHSCSLRRARRAAQTLIDTLNGFQFFHENMVFEVGASVGITAINRHVESVNDVMAEADLACYAAKDKGRNQVQIYQKRDLFIRQRREEMYRAGGIRTALDQGRFVLYGQPIIALGSDETCERVEVLLRMLGDHDRLIMPSAFIPAAERYGFMADVDRWVIEKTIDHLGCQGGDTAANAVNINLSGVTLSDETSLEFISRTLTFSNVPPELISFEITETAALRNIVKTTAFMRELRDWGCSFSLDDFGSGLSSLSYLKRLPVDYVKIDGSFIRDVVNDDGSRVLVEAIHSMARGLGIKTVAEGVEDIQTLKALRDLGIDYVQGYAIGRPSPMDADTVSGRTTTTAPA